MAYFHRCRLRAHSGEAVWAQAHSSIDGSMACVHDEALSLTADREWAQLYDFGTEQHIVHGGELWAMGRPPHPLASGACPRNSRVNLFVVEHLSGERHVFALTCLSVLLLILLSTRCEDYTSLGLVAQVRLAPWGGCYALSAILLLGCLGVSWHAFKIGVNVWAARHR